MKLTGVLEVWHSNAEQATHYHEACYAQIACDMALQLINVPEHWIDPGCAYCRRGLAVYPVDEQMDRAFNDAREEI